MSTTKTRLSKVGTVCVPVSDTDRAIAFYVDTLGFEKRVDVPFGGQYRWVEVYPPEGGTGIALAPPAPGSDHVEPAQTGITLTTTDIDATHAAFKQLGIDVDAEVSRMGAPVPPLFWFRDPDNNSLMIVEVS